MSASKNNKYAAAIRVTKYGDDSVTMDRYIHECHRIASALFVPVLAEWREDEFLVDPLKRCPCVECARRT